MWYVEFPTVNEGTTLPTGTPPYPVVEEDGVPINDVKLRFDPSDSHCLGTFPEAVFTLAIGCCPTAGPVLIVSGNGTATLTGNTCCKNEDGKCAAGTPGEDVSCE
jgi:hypothetical protein